MSADANSKAPTTAANANPKAYSYKRFSTPEQIQGDSLRRQTAMAEAWAAARGLELDKELTFTDLGVSAFRGRNVDQGALGEFLRAIEDGLVAPGSILLVESLDRLSRQTARRALRALEGIVDAGVAVVTLDNGREYTAEALDRDPLALIEFVIRATTSHEESVKKAGRLRQAWIGKRQAVLANGGVLTARGPGWLTLVDGQWQVIEERADVVRRIFDLVVQGAGLETVAARLNREKVPVFGRGQMWFKSYIQKIVMNPAVVGTMVPHAITYDSQGKRHREPTGEAIEGYFPAVIERDVWEAVQALKGPGRRAPASTSQKVATHLLAGLATCPRCGSTMTKVTKSSRRRERKAKLVCTRSKVGAGCEYRTVDLETAEKALIAGLDQAAAEAPGPDEGIARQLEVCEGEIAGTEDALERLLDALQAAPDSAALVSRLGDLERALSDLRERHADLLRQSLLADRRGYFKRQQAAVGALKGDPLGAPLDKVRANAALRAAVDRVVVDYLEGRLHVHWLGDGVSSITYAWPTAKVATSARPE